MTTSVGIGSECAVGMSPIPLCQNGLRVLMSLDPSFSQLSSVSLIELVGSLSASSALKMQEVPVMPLGSLTPALSHG